MNRRSSATQSAPTRGVVGGDPRLLDNGWLRAHADAMADRTRQRILERRAAFLAAATLALTAPSSAAAQEGGNGGAGGSGDGGIAGADAEDPAAQVCLCTCTLPERNDTPPPWGPTALGALAVAAVLRKKTR